MAKKTSWFEFLGSVRFAIFLLIILTVVSLVGIVIPQDLPDGQYIHQWGRLLSRILLPLGVTHVFTTPWFYLLLGLLSLNILVCAVLKLWKKMDNALKFRFLPSSQELSQFKHSFSFKTSGNEAAVKDALQGYLKKGSYAFSAQESAGAVQIAASRGKLKEIGSLLFHVSIVIIFIGGLVAKLGGYSYLSELSNGASAVVRERDFRVKSDGFKLERNNDGSVKSFKTNLSLIRFDNSVIVNKIIEVNSPLAYEGIRFYQSSYGEEPDAVENATLKISGPGIDTVSGPSVESVPFDAPAAWEKSGCTVRLLRFVPDFMIDMATHEVSSRSDKPENPALNVVLLKGKDTLFSHWVFLKYPDMHSEKEKYRVQFLDYTPLYYTGIEVRKNPGVPFIWAGILFMTFGIFCMFYVAKRNLWIFIEKKEGGEAVVSLAGSSNREHAGFDMEFDRIKTEVEQFVLKGGK